MPAVVAINLTATAPAGIEPEEGGLILAEPRTRRAAPSPHGQLVSPPGGGGEWVRVILSPLLEEVEEVFLPYKDSEAERQINKDGRRGQPCMKTNKQDIRPQLLLDRSKDTLQGQ